MPQTAHVKEGSPAKDPSRQLRKSICSVPPPIFNSREDDDREVVPGLSVRHRRSGEHTGEADDPQNTQQDSAPLAICSCMLDGEPELLAAITADYASGALEARISSLSTWGGVESSSSALAKSALAISPRKVGVSACFVFEGIEDARSCPVRISRHTRCCAGLTGCQRLRRFQKLFQFLFFAGLRIQQPQQCKLIHANLRVEYRIHRMQPMLTAARNCLPCSPGSDSSRVVPVTLKESCNFARETKFARCFCAFLSRRGTVVCTLRRWCLPTIPRCCLPTRE